MKIIKSMLFMLLISSILLVSAFTPQDDIELRNFYAVYNATNMTSDDFCIIGGSCLSDASGTITAVNTNDNYLDGGAVSGEVNLTMNETYLNSTIDARVIADTDTKWTLDDVYLNNISDVLTFNETRMNTTIDARNTDTTYTASTGLNLTGTVFSVNNTYLMSVYQPHTNRTCGAGDFVNLIGIDGTVTCGTPAGSGTITAVNTNGPYLTGGAVSGAADLLVDESYLNSTIDARENDTVYTADDYYIYLATQVISFNETRMNNTIDARSSSFNVNSSNYWDALDTTTDITSLGTIGTGVWAASIIEDTYITQELTINGSGSVNWTSLNSYPASCPADSFVTQIADSTTCTGISDVYLLNSGDTGDGTYNFINGNLTVEENISITGVDSCMYLPGGGKVCGNSTCSTVYSPNGNTVIDVCN